MKTFSLVTLAFLLITLLARTASAQDVPTPAGPQSGQTLVFIGDSITQMCGWVPLVDEAFKHVGRPLTVINAGISGHSSRNMLARLKTDVLDKKPQWMVLNCGVNDVVGRGPGGAVPLDEFKTDVTSMVDQATAAGIKVVLTTVTQVGESMTEGGPQQFWLDGGAGVGYGVGQVVLSERQSEEMHDRAEKQGLSAEDYLTKEIQRGMPLILSQPPEPSK